MSAKPFPTGRDPLRRLGTTLLIAALGGLLAIVYAMVTIARGSAGPVEWMLGVGVCLLYGAATASQIQIVLLGHRARIEALERRAAADANRPADETPP
jgi:hypothetical protein